MQIPSLHYLYKYHYDYLCYQTVHVFRVNTPATDPDNLGTRLVKVNLDDNRQNDPRAPPDSGERLH